MAKNVRIVKGKVVVEGQLTAAEETLLRSKYGTKKVFEFWRIKSGSLSFLSELSAIEDLSLVNAVLEDASALGSLRALRRLFLNGVKLTSGLGFLADLKELEELHLLNLRGDVALPDLASLGSLCMFRVWGCKQFSDVSVLVEAPLLEEVEFVDTALLPEDLLPLFEKTSIRYINAQFKTKKHNDTFVGYLAEFGKTQYRPAVSPTP